VRATRLERLEDVHCITLGHASGQSAQAAQRGGKKQEKHKHKT
jgi:hypothetical protein